MRSSARIAIDPGGLDALKPGSGQFRYLVDLVMGLDKLRSEHAFVFVGSLPEPPPALQNVFQRTSSNWHYRYIPRATGPGSMYRDQVRIAWFLLRHRIQLCHALHTPLPVLAPCPVVATKYDLMYEIFDDYAPARRSRPYRLGLWGLCNRARRIIAISRQTALDLGRIWRVPSHRIDVVLLGSDLADRWSRSSALSADLPAYLSHDGPTLVSPYNLEPRKNLATLLCAIPRLLGAFPNLRLILFGRAAVTDEREAQFQAAVRELGIASCVQLTGIIDDDQLCALYRRATVFVFPSLYEGFGLPLLEAMAAGACVVARRASAMAEVVGDAGLCLETASPDELASGLATLLQDNDARGRLSEAARHQARLFSVRRMAEQTLDVYRRALNGVCESIVWPRSMPAP
jgi:glycosyltransferase involved in cell wall biosynthesis